MECFELHDEVFEPRLIARRDEWEELPELLTEEILEGVPDLKRIRWDQMTQALLTWMKAHAHVQKISITPWTSPD